MFSHFILEISPSFDLLWIARGHIMEQTNFPTRAMIFNERLVDDILREVINPEWRYIISSDQNYVKILPKILPISKSAFRKI
jgi:hypothetical protein